MKKDPELLRLPPKDWAKLDPCATSHQDLMALIDGMPKKLSGTCCMCESTIREEWCTATSNTSNATELRHLAETDIGILRPSELALIKQWLIDQNASN